MVHLWASSIVYASVSIFTQNNWLQSTLKELVITGGVKVSSAISGGSVGRGAKGLGVTIGLGGSGKMGSSKSGSSTKVGTSGRMFTTGASVAFGFWQTPSMIAFGGKQGGSGPENKFCLVKKPKNALCSRNFQNMKLRLDIWPNHLVWVSWSYFSKAAYLLQ